MAGLYAADGSYNVTVVDGTAFVGVYAPDGSYNVTVINQATPQETARALSTWYVADASAAQVSLTGSTSETVLKTVTIPANSLGPNGVLNVTFFVSYPNNANTKTLRIRLGGIGGTIVLADAPTTTTSTRYNRTIQNRNSLTSQIAGTGGGGGYGSSGSAILTSAINTANAFDLVITGQLADGADTLILESALVEILYKA